MKNRILIIIVAAVAVTAAVLCFLFLGKKPEAKKNKDKPADGKVYTDLIDSVGNFDVLSVSSKKELEEFAKKNKHEIYDEAGYLWLSDVPLFDTTAQIDAMYKGDSLDYLTVSTYIYEVPYPETEENAEYIPHKLTDAEMEESNKEFETFKLLFEQYLDCGNIPYYDSLPTGVSQSVDTSAMTDDEKFVNGYVVREYSVIDKDGTLWMLRHSASDYYTIASITKMTDKTQYEGFMPIVDMTKNS